MAKKGKAKRKRGKKFRAFEQSAADPDFGNEGDKNPIEMNFRNNKRRKLAEAEDKREAIAKEYRNQNNVNSFVDKRIGESDANLSLEQKMEMRFAKERKESKRAKKFFLEDDESDGPTFKLTHKGRALEEADDFKEHVSDSSDDGRIQDEVVEQFHFGGGDQEQDKDDLFTVKKTKDQVYTEIMLKSKLYKEQQAKQKEENDEEIDKLDEQLVDIAPLL
jgi:nucleolar protein 14